MNKFLIILLSLGLLLSFNVVNADQTYNCFDDMTVDIEAFDCVDYCDFVSEPHCLMPDETVCYCNPLSGDGLESISDPIIDFIFKISVVVVPVLVVYGAFMIITAAGDAEKIKQAKAMIFWTLIGFTIVLLSRGVSDLIEVIIGI